MGRGGTDKTFNQPPPVTPWKKALSALGGFIFASVWLTANGYATLGLPGGFGLATAAALVAAVLPRVLVVSLSAALGAALTVAGVLVLGGWISVDGRGLPTAFDVPAPWVLAWIVLSALGVCVQLLTIAAESPSHGTPPPPRPPARR